MSDDGSDQQDRMGTAWSENNNRINTVRRIRSTIEAEGIEKVDEDVLIDVFTSIEEQLIEEKEQMEGLMDNMRDLEELDEKIEELQKELEEARDED